MKINDTRDYYIKDKPVSMLDEITLSHLLRRVGDLNKKTYGEMIGRIVSGNNILEVGPGLGDLANGFSKVNEFKKYTFCELSPNLMNNLKEKFGERYAFGENDLFNVQGQYDLLICNEVLGDLQTAVDIDKNNIPKEIQEIVDKYDLDISDAPKNFNFNIGAFQFLEKAKDLSSKIFICEHSSEWPQRIPVHGHDEYTIKFGFLEQAAVKLGFEIKSGKASDFIGIKSKFICLALQPELRMYKDKIREDDWTRAFTPEEAMEILKTINIDQSYGRYLRMNAKPFTKISDQFRYLVLTQ